jgi:hypothetical protein
MPVRKKGPAFSKFTVARFTPESDRRADVLVALGPVTWQINPEGTGRGFAMSDLAQFVGNLNVARFVPRLREERDPTTRSSLHRLLLEEANNLAFNLGQLGSLRREVIEGRARIAIQIAVVETLTANGQDARLAESMF